MKPAEATFKQAVQDIITEGKHPSAVRILVKLGRKRNSGMINGRETKWRAEVLRELGWSLSLDQYGHPKKWVPPTENGNYGFEPDWVSPPGDTIQDLLEERGLTSEDLALETGFSPEQVDLLLRGDMKITGLVAERLGTFFKKPTPNFWARREEHYRESLKRRGLS